MIACTARTLTTAQTRPVFKDDTEIRNTDKVYKLVWATALTRRAHEGFKLGKQLYGNIRENVKLGNTANVRAAHQRQPNISATGANLSVPPLFYLRSSVPPGMRRIYPHVFHEKLGIPQERATHKTSRSERRFNWGACVFLIYSNQRPYSLRYSHITKRSVTS